MGLCTQFTVFLHCRYSELQARKGNNAMQPLHNQAYNNMPNMITLRQNQAYGREPERVSPDSRANREYEVIPPLANEKTRLNNYTEIGDDRESSNAQISQGMTQPHQQASPEQPSEEVEGNHMRQGPQVINLKSGEHEDMTGKVNIDLILEPKAQDEFDEAAPYEIPVSTKMVTKNP